ncbi:SRA-YDG [Dendrothele bispora CBS 962.96]|uniref:SRA-YDG n=1 Tax=Dendrothele bispora (strain CBS 962.96) TaxID=1314807 RepID=A0A4S8MIL8_DENBC|nr:SRA-YDG [Dendrothele bispora CBS 962.96]
MEAKRRQLLESWQNNDEIFQQHEYAASGRIGKVDGVVVGQLFRTRQQLSDYQVHRQTRAGIHGNPKEGAFAIVLSDKYEDDVDQGNLICYTGTGGKKDVNDDHAPQVEDQSFSHPMNASLLKSMETGKPVRVVRGMSKYSKYAPSKGYRYDGLYKVVKASAKKGQSGYMICSFELERLPDQPSIPIRDLEF